MIALIQKFKNLCLILSGTDINLYAFCPKDEKIKRVIMGASVLFVGIFAFISTTMFISILFQRFDVSTKEISVSTLGKVLSPIIGLLWAGFIIVIDMNILSVKSKWAAFVRIPIAIAIGLVVAVPLEIYICSDYVNRELIINNQSANDRYESEYKEAVQPYQERVEQLQKSAHTHTSEMLRWSDIMEAEAVGRIIAGRTGRSGEGPAYKEAERNFDLHKQMLNNTKAELEDAKAELKEVQSTSMQQLQNKEISASLDFLSQYKMMSEIRKQKGNEDINLYCWFITLLFVFMELTPALLKVSDYFSKRQCIYQVLEAARAQIALQSIIITTNEAMRQVAQHKYDILDPTKSLDQYSPKGLVKTFKQLI